jgi:hypothetical protein
MRSLKMLILVLILSLVSVGIAQDTTQPPLDLKPSTSIIICPHDVYLEFSTRKEALRKYPEVFKDIEVDGHILLGFTFIPGCEENKPDLKKTVILVMVDDASLYTRPFVERLAKILFMINSPGFNIASVDFLLDQPPSAWEIAGVLDHELAHCSDVHSNWNGRQSTMIYELFPHIGLEQPSVDIQKQNPWAALRALFPSLDTHKGYSSRSYK